MLNKRIDTFKVSIKGNVPKREFAGFSYLLDTYGFYKKDIILDQNKKLINISFFNEYPEILKNESNLINKKYGLENIDLKKHICLTIRDVESSHMDIPARFKTLFDENRIYLGDECGLYIKKDRTIIITGLLPSHYVFNLYIYVNNINILFEEYFIAEQDSNAK